MHNNNNIKIIIEGIYIVSYIENKKTKGLGPPPSPPPPQFITRETAKPATTTTTNEIPSHLSLSLSNTLLTQASLKYFLSMLLLFYLSFIYFIIITVIIFKLLFFRHFLETPFFVFFKHKPTKSFFNVNVRSC
jgi:hypothetical protein